MKDPVVLCQFCKQQARKLRYKTGYRCTTPKCIRNMEIIATDQQVAALKLYLVDEARAALLAWAKGCQTTDPGQKRRLKCLPSPYDPTSTAPVIDGVLVV